MSGSGVSQAMQPHGVGGRLFAVVMEWINTPAYRRAAGLMSPGPGERVLEIGFGTGALMAMLAPRMAGGLLAGIDPSALMMRQRPEWLPNPVSRTADEIGGTLQALRRAGLEGVERLPNVGSSAVLVASG